MNATAIVPVPVGYVDRHDALLVPLAGRSALAHLVATVQPRAEVVLAAAPPLADVVVEAVDAQHLSSLRVVVADRPGERVQCLSAGVAACGTGPVVILDLAWAACRPGTVQRLCAELAGGAPVVVPTTAVTDSVKRIDRRGIVTATWDRSRLRTTQFPRGFDAATLRALLAGAEEPFDEVGAALRAGVPVTEIDGDGRAQRLELPCDARYLTAVLEAQPDR
ncbi:IspD/TarI family cytidylyltransferase [Mycolicibacterium duvalii]|uniref:2-C-methyl-D-erythritol 4-phosphate cytidylyltransferase n=1 Tax=Mycolicibacterium duvalii TaxID=39688 RepID=A0A7I7JWK7_9MYCO|nr:2-C-methyl-D-erythritol 4-phosphate cytidylyltransferase [Mycolicibacterium duvalii]MCV7370084.1 2-C-methyl-D-erythritol 4-phosphate cytidylyltransferase [Mycolicibacterium duvalii]BBX15689.1 2-C-methyl-D-erythritol 4-phosphate cytidylyltransferase [Mycolicibacterium duvalii]